MGRVLGIAYSSLNTVVKSEGETQKLWVKEVQDLARGLCGALFVALPLLYTMEMWERALATPAWILIGLVGIAYLANVGYILFEGFKPEPERHTAWLDAITAMGLGAVGSAITLLLLGRLTPSMPLDGIVRIILLEMVPTSFGASLAINQLGERAGHHQGDTPPPVDKLPHDLRKVLATILGALLFSFNIAPTFEPQLIAYTISWWHLLALIGFALFVSGLTVFFADFVERDEHTGVLRHEWVETLVAYLLSLGVSAFLLWSFGYFAPGVPFQQMLAWTITLGYVTTLGGSAGRLIL